MGERERCASRHKDHMEGKGKENENKWGLPEAHASVVGGITFVV